MKFVMKFWNAMGHSLFYEDGFFSIVGGIVYKIVVNIIINCSIGAIES